MLSICGQPAFRRWFACGVACGVACAFLSLLAPLAWPDSRALPEDADIRVLARPLPGKLELLVRTPLAVVRNAQLPVQGDTGSLDLSAMQSMLFGIAQYWIAPAIDVFDDTQPVKPQISAARISAPSDRSFGSYQDAWAHLRAPALQAADISRDSAWLDVAFEYPLQAGPTALSIHPKVARLAVRVSTNMTYLAPDGSARTFIFEGDPGLIYPDARWRDTAAQFLARGFGFVFHSADFPLFLFCLVLPLRQYKTIFPATAAFAGALCLALLAYGAGFAPDTNWFSPLIETLSALAILLAALANIMGGVTPRRRALFALLAGLVYGYTVAIDLAGKIQFAGMHQMLARTTYGLGAALAAVLAIAVLTPALGLIFRYAGTRRVELIIVSALAADTAWGWLATRWDRLSRFPFQVPVLDASLLAATLRWLMFAVLLGALLWFVDGWLKHESKPE
jgi:hypothetical protein